MEYLYHYFNVSTGPFLSLSRLSIEDARTVQSELKKKNTSFAAQRDDGYLHRRRELEEMAYAEFRKQGGKPRSRYPHYLVVEECPWLETWYASPRRLKIPIAGLNMEEISFTYGDLFPTFSESLDDRREYWKKIYTWAGMKELIEKYGLPQIWNGDGKHGPERYIEAHVWTSREEIMKRLNIALMTPDMDEDRNGFQSRRH